jgi:hypothetical protein
MSTCWLQPPTRSGCRRRSRPSRRASSSTSTVCFAGSCRCTRAGPTARHRSKPWRARRRSLVASAECAAKACRHDEASWPVQSATFGSGNRRRKTGDLRADVSHSASGLAGALWRPVTEGTSRRYPQLIHRSRCKTCGSRYLRGARVHRNRLGFEAGGCGMRHASDRTVQRPGDGLSVEQIEPWTWQWDETSLQNRKRSKPSRG